MVIIFVAFFNVQWNPSIIVDTLGTWYSVLYREVSSFQEPLYCGHLGDLA